MKILFVTDLYPIKSGENTTPLTLHNFVTEWIKQGHSVDVIKPNFILNSFLRNKPYYPDGYYNYEGVKIYNVNYHTPFLFKFFKKIPNELKFGKYDIIIAHMPSGIIFANKLSKLMKKPLICAVHYSDIEILTNPLYSIYFKEQLEEAYKRAKKIACRSFALQDKFIKLMPKLENKTFLAPSGIDTSKINNKTHSPFHPFTSSPIKVLTCANLIKRKNIDKLILAIKDLNDFELTVIGDGVELDNLKSINASNVNFFGRLPHEKVLKEMEKADVFILPSVNETFGMVYLEAMSAGCITVCCKNDGIDGIIKDNENGFLTEPHSEKIKETLYKIKNLTNKDTIIQNSLNTAKIYSKEACAKNYLQSI